MFTSLHACPALFWLAGQGGHGIPSADGAARLAAALLPGQPLTTLVQPMSEPWCESWVRVDSGHERCLAGFLHTIDIDAADVHSHCDAFDRVRSGTLQAIIVHGVYTDALMQQIVHGLEQHQPAFLKTWFPAAFKAWFYGRNINLADAALSG